MPGTIQVSVFDFKNISSSSICLWVSMGKRAYQTWDKGDFSFPLTTFRDNLVVRLEDVEGNEISRKEVETLSIVEKGCWDDVFQLEGGHYVHMKLQFSLSEDERNLIRNVRESALKKKQDKVPVTIVKYKGTAVPMRDTFALSLPITREFSDRSEVNSSSPVKEGVEKRYSEPDRPSAEKLQTQLIQNDSAAVKPVYDQDVQSILKMDVTGKKHSVSQQKILSDPSNKSEDQSGRSMLKMDVAVKKESISQKRNADSEDQDTQSMLKMDVAAKKESVSQKNIVDLSNEPDNQGVLEKTPSSVRKMISAFETGLTQKKGRRSLTRTRASKSQPNLVGIGGSLKDLDSDNISRPNKMSALRLERPLNTVDLPEPQINIGKRGQNSSPEQDFVGTEQPVFHEELKQSSVHIVRFNEAGSSQQETFVSAKKESNTVATSPVDLMRLSNLETATSSQTTSVAHPDVLKANNLAANRDSFNGPSVAEKQNREIRSETLPEVHFEKASNVKPKLIACREDELYDSENSGAWIFPDNKKRLCMTSAGKNIVHLSEDCRIGVDDHQSNKRPSMQETTGKRSFFHRSDSMTKKGREKPQKPRNQSKSFGENGSSGPVRQVMNIALVVGFGILVLLTRQRETRKNDRKSKDFYFTSPDFMDQLASSEEQWSVLKR
ncbi:hypothetical protein KY285_030563 [Solanum tuberosum]|nr:hypothetical protein KY289_030702 [Solanum tuberosum]KAH0655681.1 hypothetical protein KY285_030563 [Solanum tuberosum]